MLILHNIHLKGIFLKSAAQVINNDDNYCFCKRHFNFVNIQQNNITLIKKNSSSTTIHAIIFHHKKEKTDIFYS